MALQLNRRQMLIAAGSMLTAAVAGCSGTANNAQTGPPLKIGWLIPLSGKWGSIGEEMRVAFNLYLEQKGGKFGGREVQLHTVDQGTAAETAAIAEDLIVNEEIHLIAGVPTPSAYNAVLDVINDRVPLLCSGERPAVDPGIAYGLWHTGWTAAGPAKAVARHLKENMDGPTYLVGPDSGVAREHFNTFMEEYGDQIANPTGAASYVSMAQAHNECVNASNVGAGAVYVTFSGTDAAEFIKAYKDSPASNIPLFGPFLTEGSLLTQGRNELVGVYNISNYYQGIDNKPNREFTAAYRKVYSGRIPSAFSVAAWDTALVIDKAVEAYIRESRDIVDLSGKEITGDHIDQALAYVGEIDSPRGPWRFEENTHVPVQRWHLTQVHDDGGILVNEPIEELATVSG